MKPHYTAEQIRRRKADAKRELDVLYGRGEYNSSSNICWGDAYFAASIMRQFNCDDLTKLDAWANS